MTASSAALSAPLPRKKTISRRKRLNRQIGAFAAFICFLALAVGTLFLPPVWDGIKVFEEQADEQSIALAVAKLEERGSYTPYEEIPEEYFKILMRHEDRRFYYHFGLDPIAIARATLVNLSRGGIVQGASTITQQLAKNLLFSEERTLERKIAEALTSMRLERLYSKEEILEFYCNAVYYGEDCYGIGEAAEYYYGKTPMELTSEEMEALVRSLPAPSYLNPEVLAARELEALAA